MQLKNKAYTIKQQQQTEDKTNKQTAKLARKLDNMFIQ